MTGPVVPFGDSAWLVEVDDVETAHRLASAVEAAMAAGSAPTGTGDVVVGFHSLVVRTDPLTSQPERCQSWLAELAAADLSGSRPDDDHGATSGRRIEVPTVFNGPDLEEVAAAAGVSTEAVVDLLTGGDLQVAFLGFSPGFSYLVGLPPALAGIERRATPRTSVPPGSVALAGGFAAIYPRASPGGWMLVGQTSLPLFDPEVAPYARLRSGDIVRFRAADETERRDGVTDAPVAADAAASPRAAARARSQRFVEVLEPGLLTLVEDGGRSSVASIGIPDAGPADPDAMRLANRLVGNPEDAGALEVTARGPTLRFEGDAHVAVVAAASDVVDVRVDGHTAGTDSVVPVRSGQTVAIGQVRHGLRAYLAVAGGIDILPVVGSRSSDVLSGLGLGPLVMGDQLDLGIPDHPRGLLTHSPAALQPAAEARIRVVEGPHPLGRANLEALCSVRWRVADASNRVGLRLSAPDTPLTPAGRILSTGTITGAIQVPPDGQPIVLMPDHATVGGYPIIACVISADLAKLGQLRGGDHLRFELVSPESARSSLVEHERRLSGRVSGWFPAESGT
ncbi:MAG TPA: 5-oxoprolinase/urea amidolyase family protein [Acidimicrobiales bacterium]|jgi:KipI family sensor histidine kinase inhibitor|nr:5-oxoprolinase/urea amidolyase family protein [Acidimicrobiales bacterium]